MEGSLAGTETLSDVRPDHRAQMSLSHSLVLFAMGTPCDDSYGIL